MVKILDFGIAKLAAPGGGGSNTRTGGLLGTPLYMSPEQCRGLKSIDRRADIYALGCVMFEMATGRHIFVNEASGDLLVAHIIEPPPRVSSLRPEIPAWMDDLVARMLAKAPEDRPSSMDEVVSAMEGFLKVTASEFATKIPATGALGRVTTPRRPSNASVGAVFLRRRRPALATHDRPLPHAQISPRPFTRRPTSRRFGVPPRSCWSSARRRSATKADAADRRPDHRRAGARRRRSRLVDPAQAGAPPPVHCGRSRGGRAGRAADDCACARRRRAQERGAEARPRRPRRRPRSGSCRNLRERNYGSATNRRRVARRRWTWSCAATPANCGESSRPMDIEISPSPSIPAAPGPWTWRSRGSRRRRYTAVLRATARSTRRRPPPRRSGRTDSSASETELHVGVPPGTGYRASVVKTRRQRRNNRGCRPGPLPRMPTTPPRPRSTSTGA